MSTHNIGFYEEISKIIIKYHQISLNMHLISSAGLLQGLQNERYINKDSLTKFILTFVFVVC